MPNFVAFAILAAAAVLEAGGDALVRHGLHGHAGLQRIGVIAIGGLVLTTYGVVVNTPPWDFGRLLGVYVTLFFLAAQIINAVAFKLQPSLPVMVGGGLVIAGGLVMAFWKGTAS